MSAKDHQYFFLILEFYHQLSVSRLWMSSVLSLPALSGSRTDSLGKEADGKGEEGTLRPVGLQISPILWRLVFPSMTCGRE